MTYASAPNRPSAAGLAVAGCIHVVLGWLVLQGLAARLAAPPAMPSLVVAFNVPQAKREPPPPPSKPVEPERKAAPRRSAPAPRAVQLPKIVLDQPRAIAVAPKVATGVSAGRGTQGTGIGSGTGEGSETGGSGSGAGAASPAIRVAGSLGDRDYPREFAAQGAGGTVAIAFRVRTDGRVDGCQVLASSGFAALDNLTCALVERRFHYNPARDTAGANVESTLRTTFTWGTRRSD